MSDQEQTNTEHSVDADTQDGGVAVKTPEFTSIQPLGGSAGSPRSLQSVYNVSVTVTAELGRVQLPISELLQLGAGSIVELNRPVSSPIDLRADGVLLARGEVVVVDDCFAVRLSEVTQPESSEGS